VLCDGGSGVGVMGVTPRKDWHMINLSIENLPMSLEQKAELLEEEYKRINPTSGESDIYDLRWTIVTDAGYWQSDSEDDDHGYWYPPDWEPDDGSGDDGEWEVISSDIELLSSYCDTLKEYIDGYENK